MGKQLYFAHTEEDIAPFLSYLNHVGAKIIINGALNEPLKMHAQFLSDMSGQRIPQYSVVYPADDIYTKSGIDVDIAQGTAIEIMNCRKWLNASNTYYDKGRIYLSRTETGEYDPDLVFLYNKICSYIRKNYIKSKQFHIYFSNKFKERYDVKQVFISQLGRPINN